MKIKTLGLMLIGVELLQVGLAQTPSKTKKNTTGKVNKIEKTAFGTLPNGSNVDLFTLRNANGMEVQITNYGGIITNLLYPIKMVNMPPLRSLATRSKDRILKRHA